MFDQLETAPPDAILGLTEAFRADSNPKKVNLTVGVYKDATGRTPILSCVKEAEKRILAAESTKGYLPMTGSPEFARHARELLFGEGRDLVDNGRALSAQTPGGTGALRVAGDFIKVALGGRKVWLSEPTWPNHPGIFQAAGLETATYPYYDPTGYGLAFEKMLESLAEIPASDVVVLHACCHNPTGVDPSPEQWRKIAGLVSERGLLPLVDFAYQGFADGLDEDTAGVRALCQVCPELLVCSSFSKNFGLYNERVGALTLIAASPAAAEAAMSHVKLRVRTNYSNPPSHGGSIVTTVLSDEQLRETWLGELAAMRDRIYTVRRLFVERLKAAGVGQDFSFIEKQRGMFSFSGLSREQVLALREKHAIYVVDSGRINVAGMTEDNMDYLCTAIAGVL